MGDTSTIAKAEPLGRISDEIRADITRGGSKCSLSVALKALSDEDRVEVEQLLAVSNDEIPHSTLARWLRREVPTARVHAKTVAAHRAGECSCG